MGVMARKRAEQFVITSDRAPAGTAIKRAPKNLSDTYLSFVARARIRLNEARTLPSIGLKEANVARLIPID
jgi:hypothetical protein